MGAGAVGGGGSDPEASVDETAQAYVERMRAARGHGGVRIAKLMDIATEIARIEPPATGLDILRRAFARLEDDRLARIVLLKAFNEEKHSFVLAALQLGDADPQVRATVDAYRLKYAFGSFLHDDAGLQAWNDRFGHLPLAEAWPSSAADFVARLNGASPEEAKGMLVPVYSDMFVTQIDTMRRLGVTQTMADGGLAATARRLFDAPALKEERGKLLTMVLAVDPSDQTARDFVLPLLANAGADGSDVVSAAARELGRRDRPWAAPALADALTRIGYREALTTALAEALVKCSPGGGIPELIGVLSAHDTDQMRLSLGTVLEQLTGVRPDRAHDARFWARWWQENRHNFEGVEHDR